MRRQIAWIMAVLSLAAVVLVVALATVGWQSLNRPLAVAGEGEWLEVPPGSSLAAVSRGLAERGVLPAPRLLAYYGRLTGAATRIHAGEYRLAAGTTPMTLLKQLVGGQVYLHQLTVVEGWRFRDFQQVLRAHPAVEATELDAAAIMTAIGAEGVDPEGQFAPDTYRFPRGISDIAIFEQAYLTMQERLVAIWDRRSPNAAVTTPYEALILASIIEKETALASERRQIAGVFSRRLQRGMRLQTDPTVIYGMGVDFDGDIRRADLTLDTPYNTYTRTGLPPTPIALPGSDALRAAVDPDDAGALYFVATGLDDGSHAFSSTLEEHNRAVATYLRRLRERNQPSEPR
jgi:UPF0755 protein